MPLPRGWALLLCAYLLVWVPLGFSNEVLVTLPSAARRDTVTVVELAVHALATALCAAAGWMVLVRNPAAMPMAVLAIIVSLAVSIQSVVWTVLPRQIAPGQRIPVVVLASLHAGFWLAMIGANHWRRRRDD